MNVPTVHVIYVAEKEKLLSHIRIMSVVALFIGVVSLVVGILVFVYLGGGKYPITTATGIWYAFMVCINDAYIYIVLVDFFSVFYNLMCDIDC